MDWSGRSAWAARLHSDWIKDIGKDPMRLKAKSKSTSASICFFGINFMEFRTACGFETDFSFPTGEADRLKNEPNKLFEEEEEEFEAFVLNFCIKSDSLI